VYTGDVASDVITVVMSNAKTRRTEPQRTPTSLAATASRMFGKPSTQYLNAMTIATSEAIADTGATSIFVMEGADVKNKRPAIKPLTINLPDGRQIKSTHICDIDIPGLPTTLTGHIVPNLAIDSLFGIRVLCKAGCKVVFDDENVTYYIKTSSSYVVIKIRPQTCGLSPLFRPQQSCGPPQGHQRRDRT
jgi:hypothetical protein